MPRLWARLLSTGPSPLDAWEVIYWEDSQPPASILGRGFDEHTFAFSPSSLLLPVTVTVTATRTSHTAHRATTLTSWCTAHKSNQPIPEYGRSDCEARATRRGRR